MQVVIPIENYGKGIRISQKFPELKRIANYIILADNPSDVMRSLNAIRTGYLNCKEPSPNKLRSIELWSELIRYYK